MSAPAVAEPALRVTCWGTRGSIPAPGPATVRFGGNTSCVEIRAAGCRLIFDAGTGIRALSGRVAAEGRPLDAHLFVTHYHWDHIQGFPFLAQLYEPATKLRVHGPMQGTVPVDEALEGQMSPLYFPVPLGAIAASVEFATADGKPWRGDGVHVDAYRVNHPGVTYGYRVTAGGATAVYVPDNELGDAPDPAWYQGLVEFVQGADLLLHDAMLTTDEYLNRHGWGHSTFQQAVRLAEDAGVRRLRLFHHAPDRTDAELEAIAARLRGELVARGSALELEVAAEGEVIAIPAGGRVSGNERDEEALTDEPPAERRGPPPVLLHAPGADLGTLREALAAEGVELVPVDSWDDVAAPDVPTVLLLDEAVAVATSDLASVLRHVPEAVAVVAQTDRAERLSLGCDRVVAVLRPDPAAAAAALRVAFRLSAARLGAARMERELARTRSELRELAAVGMALMTERDPDRLLEKIVTKARQLTGSDAGSLYLVEEGPEGLRLRFNLAQNDSLPDAPFVSFPLPLDPGSLAGYAATTGETLQVDDAYRLPPGAPYALNRSFDERFGYRTKSMLVVPMIDHGGVVVGVLQLINRKRLPLARIIDEDDAARWVLPYTDRELVLVQALAGNAAISIENSRLYRQIENIFESFVKAAVIAVDQRDPTTSGHSVRVATLTCDLAEGLQRHAPEPYRGIRFSAEQMRELRYASLLHDFGKVGVREEVLVKAKKLPPLLQERLLSRFDLIRRTLEAEYHQRRADLLERGRRPGPELELEFRRRVEEMEGVRGLVLASNEPSILPERAAAALDHLGSLTFRGLDDRPTPYVTDEELRYLRIPKGSLNLEERLEIESHVEQTYRFLVQIPWTGDLRRVAEIAYGHHEKLNGRGYPRGVDAPAIPVQTRLMTVADIFDALTASDRPYKRALPPDRALDILSAEAGEGLLDPALVTLLIESGLYRKILEVDWKDL